MSEPPGRRVALFRGTTPGWPGNPTLSEQKITCTTTDPIVATLFAIECRNHGAAIVLTMVEVDGLVPDLENFFHQREHAVNLEMTPRDFEAAADLIIDVDRSLEILDELGFDPLPPRLSSKWALGEALAESLARGQRLDREQIQAYIKKAQEVADARQA